MAWRSFAGGSSIGKVGSEGGTIEEDEEYDGAARITLERSTRFAPFAITCGVNGWMVHTRFFEQDREARVEFDAMKTALEQIVVVAVSVESLSPNDMLARVSPLLNDFVQRFPN